MGDASLDELLQEGRAALAVADWSRARACFAEAQRRAETAEALEGLSEAAHFEGDYAEAIALKERAFAAYRQRGEREAAAGSHAGSRSCTAPSRATARWPTGGWRAPGGSSTAYRSPRSMAASPSTASPGRPTSTERERFARRRSRSGGASATPASSSARWPCSATRAVLGGASTTAWRCIDEALAAVAAGEVEAIDAIGQIYCRLLGACERTTDVRRAEQWMGTARDFTAWADFVGPTCRLHYGAILVAIGRWPEAEAELMAAARAFELGYRGMRPAALVRLAALRVRQGRLEDAELLLAGIEGHAAARVQRAAIALARGDLPLAEDLARLCLDAEDTSQPAAASLGSC